MSGIRYVESLNQSLHRMMDRDPRVLLIGEDLLDPYGGAFKAARGLSEAFPDQVITTPISEAAIVGVATGLAMRGFRPIAEIMFGDFLTLCTDQIVNHATKFPWMYDGQVEVPLVIRAPMGGYRGYGATHSQTLEAMFMNVPLLEIVAPSHYHDAGAVLEHAVLESESVTLFVENKLLYSRHLERADPQGRITDFHVRQISERSGTPTIALTIIPDEAPDLTLIAYGGMAPRAVRVAHAAFIEEEILIEVLLPARLKPIPLGDLIPSVKASGRAVIVEEGPKTGGWGGEIAAALTEAAFDELRGPIVRVGAKDLPIPSAKGMEQAVLPSDGDLRRVITRALNRR